MKSKKAAHLYANQNEDFEEQESKELDEIRRDDRKNFVRTAKEIISHNGFLTTLS